MFPSCFWLLLVACALCATWHRPQCVCIGRRCRGTRGSVLQAVAQRAHCPRLSSGWRRFTLSRTVAPNQVAAARLRPNTVLGAIGTTGTALRVAVAHDYCGPGLRGPSRRKKSASNLCYASRADRYNRFTRTAKTIQKSIIRITKTATPKAAGAAAPTGQAPDWCQELTRFLM